ncbi:MAG: SdiA-regulated domain-containing protein [Tidjanibacter sp.]|nr:SdiA-regulated domain-containing protein [Tidjanibacter sp.]
MKTLFRRLLSVSVMAVCAFALVGCDSDNGGDEGKIVDDAKTPWALGEVTTYLTDNKISGFSGVCLNENGTGLYGVSDSGEIYNISFEGEKLSKLPLSAVKDFEGIATDAVTKKVYMCEEREWAIYELAADQQNVTKVTDIFVANGVENKGLEGITCGNGCIYVSNQSLPTTIYTYSLAEGEVIDSVTVDFAKFLSDLSYDATTNTLWCVDSKQKLLFNLTLEGELLATYDVSFVPKAEGVCVDYERGVFWFCCDSLGYLYSAQMNF